MSQAPKTLKQQRRELVREQILDAARQVVLERGVTGLSLAAVARELELTKAALYYYFDSRDKLIFELVYQAHAAHAEVVAAAIEGTTSGAGALETMLRAAAAAYGSNLDALRVAYLLPQVGRDVTIGPGELERIRPFNTMIFGAVAERIAADQQAGVIRPEVDGRRLAFVAYNAVLGTLMVEALVELADDPLIHRREAMVDEIVAAFVGRL